MPVSALLERMRKLKEEKAAAAAAAAAAANTENAFNGRHASPTTATASTVSSSTSADGAWLNTATVATTSTAGMPSSNNTTSAPSVPLPPPVFASPSSARLDYRDAARDPLCVAFTADMAVPMVLELLRTSPSTNSTCELSNAKVEKPFTGTCASTAVTGRALAAEKAVRHVKEALDASTCRPSTSLMKATLDTTPITSTRTSTTAPAGGTTADQPLFPTVRGSLAFTTSLFEDGNYRRACSASRVDVSGVLRPVCRDVHHYTRVARISQGVYGVVFKAVLAADAKTLHASCTGSPSSSSSVSPVPPRAYALKHIKKMWLKESQIGFPSYLLREIDLLLRLRHPNIMGARELVLLDPTPLPVPQAATTIAPGRAEADGALAHKRIESPLAAEVDSDSGSDREHRRPRTEKTNTSASQMPPARPDALAASPPSAAENATTTSSSSSDVKDVFLVMDYCPCDLTNYMKRAYTALATASGDAQTPEEQIPYFRMASRNTHPAAAASYVARAKSITYQIIRALAFLHANRILHRDLKTANILLSEQGEVKVCDFGLGRLYREGQGLTPTVVTLMYRAPELHLGVVDYSHKMDLWSAGCILAELFLRRPLFHASSEAQHLYAITEVLGIPTEETFPGLYHLPHTKTMMQALPKWNRQSKLDGLFQPHATLFTATHGEVPLPLEATLLPASGVALLRQLLQWNPRSRPSAEEVLQHPFFHESPLPCASAELMRPMPWKSVAASRANTAVSSPVDSVLPLMVPQLVIVPAEKSTKELGPVNDRVDASVPDGRDVGEKWVAAQLGSRPGGHRTASASSSHSSSFVGVPTSTGPKHANSERERTQPENVASPEMEEEATVAAEGEWAVHNIQLRANEDPEDE